MNKYLEIYFNSLKQSVFHKPIALAMFVLMIVMATVACGFSSRMLVGEVEREMYPTTADITFDDPYIDYVAVGDFMRDIKEEYFDHYKNIGVIEAKTSITNFENNGQVDTERSIVNIRLEVFPDKFSEKSISNGEYIVYINNRFAEALGVNLGDSLSFFGSDFAIVGLEESHPLEEQYMITIPYNVNFTELNTDNAEKEHSIQVKSLNFVGLKKNLTQDIYEDLGKLGVKQSMKYFNNTIFQSSILLIALLIASSLAVITITNYWQSVNMRKYRLYKAIGASPKIIGGIMFFETGVIAALSVAIGLLFDYVISLIVNIGSITRMLWLHYLILFFATFFAIMIMVSIKIVKIAKALPMEQKLTKRC